MSISDVPHFRRASLIHDEVDDNVIDDEIELLHDLADPTDIAVEIESLNDGREDDESAPDYVVDDDVNDVRLTPTNSDVHNVAENENVNVDRLMALVMT